MKILRVIFNRNKYSKSFLIIVLAVMMFNCSSSPESDTSLSESVNPDQCRIIGIIEKIEDYRDISGLCGDNPCLTVIKIENVVERGMGFNENIKKDHTILLKFEFTLNSTEDLFPKLNKSLPGLKVGDIFTGDIEKVVSVKIDGVDSPDIYRIFNYDVIK